MTESLEEWLMINRISYKEIDKDVIEIKNFGKLFINDFGEVESIFRKDNKGEIIFNLMETKDVLINDGILYACFQFGNNWYYFDLRESFSLNILKYIGSRVPTSHVIPFVNLGIHTPYELLSGSFQISEWISKAKYLGHKTIGICDKHTMAATLLLQKECTRADIGFVIGYTLDMKSGEDLIPIKVYCQTDQGLSNLLRIQKEINVDSETKTISFNELIKLVGGNIIVFGTLSSHWIKDNPEAVNEIIKHSDGVFYQIDLSEFKANRFDEEYLFSIKFYFDEELDENIPPVLICDNYYLDKDDAKNKIILNKVATGAAHMQSDDQYYKDVDEYWEVFDSVFGEDWNKEELFKEICENTVKIANNAHAAYCTNRNFMPQYDMTEEEKKKYVNRLTMFYKILEDGFEKLVPKDKTDIYKKRMEYERYVIESTNNIDYFLIQYDTVNWATRQGIMTGISRGSGGGCLLLYLMGITKLDPIKYDLIFERFLLPDRSGLYEANTTVIKDDIPAKEYIEVAMNNRMYKFDRDAKLLVKRDEKEIEVYADELKKGDDILFDNRDLIWKINEL